MGLECMVYMVRVSYDQKPYRRIMMKTYGADVVASPSTLTARRPRASWPSIPDSPGSLGIAISEAVEDAAKRDDTKYALGSVLNHVLLHQTIIGQEAKKQMELAGDYPDILIALPRRRQQLRRARVPVPAGQDSRARGRALRAIAVEPPACPSLTQGAREYDFGDTAGIDAADDDAHARAHVHAAAGARRRPALPRLGAARQPPARGRPDRGRGLPPGRGVRERREVRALRGHDPGARSRRTRSTASSGTRSRPAKPARRRSSCSTCRDTASSTSPPTSRS